MTSVLEGGTVLYLTPTKALAADQLRALAELRLPQLRAATFDGDTPGAEREWVRQHANYVLTNPDMLHRTMLPRHSAWTSFWRRLRMVVVDECHGYRGVFGSHVAQILRRLRRVCLRYGSRPVFFLASATASDPGMAAVRLTGLETAEVTMDASPRGPMTFALWEPPLTDLRGEHGAPIRRTASAETADLLADLVADGIRTLAFVRSRRGAETVALSARRHLADAGIPLDDRIAAYRAGYLADDRRLLEKALRSGELMGLASTNALELGMDVAGLDAVLIAGWPGTRASLWQQAGRAGRDGQDALAVLIARDDPLDTYLVHHPEALFGQPVEAIVLDPDNPHVLAPHLCAAAAEIPLTEADADIFGPSARDVLDELVAQGLLRARPAGWFWARRERAVDLADIRGSGGQAVQIVEAPTGRLLGTVDEPSAHTSVHTGAVYLHQGETYVVDVLDLEVGVALVRPAQPDYTTFARDVTDISVIESLRSRALGPGELHFGSVGVTRQVVSYLRRATQSGEVIGEDPLDLPPRTLRTRAVWWTLPMSALREVHHRTAPDEAVSRAADQDAREGVPAPGHSQGAARDDSRDVGCGAKPDVGRGAGRGVGRGGIHLGGAAHAAEHASIGLLPLFATCDRWDIGGVSTELHPDTGLLTVFVYDGHDGGAGFAERGYARALDWLTATREAIASCECDYGCPSCIQSPKCGNRNDPLDKLGAIRLLDILLSRPTSSPMP